VVTTAVGAGPGGGEGGGAPYLGGGGALEEEEDLSGDMLEEGSGGCADCAVCSTSPVEAVGWSTG